MAIERNERRLLAILAADVVGYSRLMEADEADTYSRLTALRETLLIPQVDRHRGRIFKIMGDGFLVEFDSVVDAAECAVALQLELAERNREIAEDRRIIVRIGVTLGDVIVEDDDRHGEGVIIASRLQALAPAGGVLLSQQAYMQLGAKLKAAFEDQGEHTVKNLAAPVQVHGWVGQSDRPRRRLRMRHRGMLPLAALVAAVMVVAALQFWPRPDDGLPPLPAGPKIAIIPFTHLGDSEDGDGLATGLTEDIATTLSRFSNLFVFSLNATKQYEGDADPRLLGEELGAQYVLQGSLRRSETRLRVIARLQDAGDAQLVWTQTYDRDLSATDIFAVLDEITEGVVGALGSRAGVIWMQEARHALTQRTESLEAYECTALSALYQTHLAPQARIRIRTCLEEALRHSPTYAKAWTELANILLEIYKNEPFTEAEASALLQKADEAAINAIEYDGRNERAFYLRAIISQLRGEGYEAFKALADKALEINPNNGVVIGDLGNFSYYSGDYERGKALVARFMKINPNYPSWAHYVFFLDHYRKDEYPEALEEVLKITASQHCMIQWSKAAAYGKVGDRKNGAATLAHIASIEPPCPVDPREPYQKRGLPDELVESIMDGLRKAGLER